MSRWLFLSAFLLPSVTYADVVINEVAWMGTDAGGANCEWVELYNSGSDTIALSGWTLTIENIGASPKVLDLGEAASVKYSGIAGGGYYLIARNTGSCGSLMPGSSADWLGSFGSGVSNSGSKLTLSNGSTVDVVDSQEGWEISKGGIGGDNATPKQTPQRVGGAWYTGTPTPRGPNNQPSVEEIEEPEDEDSAPVVTIGGTAPLVPVSSPVPDLYIDAGPDRIVSVDADTPYTAIVYDSTGKIRRDAEVTWSFGDGGFKRGDSVAYKYREPGTYQAVVRARAKGNSSVATLDVLADVPKLRIVATEGGIQLHNDGDRLVDLSAWRIRDGREKFKLPPDLVVAPGRFAYLPNDVTDIEDVREPELLYPDGTLAVIGDVTSELPAKLSPVQEIEPVEPVIHHNAYVHPLAPAAAPMLAAAGASMPSTVILKEDQPFSLSGLLDSFFAQLTSFVVP